MNNDKMVEELAKILQSYGVGGTSDYLSKELIKLGYSRTHKTLPNVNWPKERYCDAHKIPDVDCMACQAIALINKMRNDCIESYKKAVGEAPEGIRSMEEFQRKYFPNLVGKECPYCSSKIKAVGEAQKPCRHAFSPIGCGMCKCLRCGISGVLEAQPSGLVPLDKDSAFDAALDILIPLMNYCNNPKSIKPFGIPNEITLTGRELLMSKFGTPALPTLQNVPSVDEISFIINGFKVCDVPPIRICKSDADEIATAIHDRLKGEEK